MSGEPTLLWWHWLAFGLVLVGAELVVPSFTIVWFGLAACLVGVLLLLAPSTAARAAGVHLGRGVGRLHLVLVPLLQAEDGRPHHLRDVPRGDRRPDRDDAGRGVASHLDRGRIRFAVPVLGAEEWDCISRDVLRAGDYARVTGIEGHVLNVEKNPSHS